MYRARQRSQDTPLRYPEKGTCFVPTIATVIDLIDPGSTTTPRCRFEAERCSRECAMQWRGGGRRAFRIKGVTVVEFERLRRIEL